MGGNSNSRELNFNLMGNMSSFGGILLKYGRMQKFQNFQKQRWSYSYVKSLF